jgi:MFS family permease
VDPEIYTFHYLKCGNGREVTMSDSDRGIQTATAAGALQGIGVIALASLPTMAIVSLIPNFPQLLRHFHGAPYAGLLVPMILTIPTLCIALFSPLIGGLVDRWGRRPVLCVSLAVFVILGVIPAFVSNLYWVLATRLPVGLAEAGIGVTQNALLGDYFTGQARQRWLGVLSVSNPILAALLVLAGGALGSLSWHGPFLLYLVGLPMLAWTLAWLPEPKRGTLRGTASSAGTDPFPWRESGIVGITTLGMAILYYVNAIQLGRVFAVHGVGSPAAISLYVIMASVGTVLGGVAFPRAARLRPRMRFVAVLLAYTVGYVWLGLAPTALAALVAALVSSFGNGMSIPVMIGWSLERFGVSRRGRGMGTWVACFFAGSFFSPPFVSAVQAISGSLRDAIVCIGALAGVACAVVVGIGAVGQRRRIGA